jgi:hypothetical protein
MAARASDRRLEPGFQPEILSREGHSGHAVQVVGWADTAGGQEDGSGAAVFCAPPPVNNNHHETPWRGLPRAAVV